MAPCYTADYFPAPLYFLTATRSLEIFPSIPITWLTAATMRFSE
jgi:hypothetical protein